MLNLLMPAFSGVGAGQTAIVSCPMGNKYHSLQLIYAGVTLAQLKEIRILINGSIFQRFTGTEREFMNLFDGMEASDGILVIPFERYNLHERMGMEETAFSTGVMNPETGAIINSLEIQIDIDVGALAPVLSLYAEQSQSETYGAGTLMYIDNRTYAVASAGEFTISDAPRGNMKNISCNRIYFVPSAGTVDSLEIQTNLYKVFERTSALNTRAQKNGVRNPVSTMFVYDTTESGKGGDLMNLLKLTDHRYIVKCSAINQLKMITENFGILSM